MFNPCGIRMRRRNTQTTHTTQNIQEDEGLVVTGRNPESHAADKRMENRKMMIFGQKQYARPEKRGRGSRMQRWVTTRLLIFALVHP